MGAGAISGFIAVVLIAAVIGKLTAWATWSSFAHAIAGERRRAGRVVAVSLPIVEALVAVAVLLSPASGLAAATALFGVFAVAGGATLTQRAGGSCACFGALLPGQGRRELIVRNTVLASISAAGLVLSVGAGESVHIVACAVGAAIAIATGLVLRGHQVRIGPRLGDPADVDGAGEGFSAVVLFLSPGCPSCEALADHVDEVRRATGADRLITAIVGGRESTRRAIAERVGASARLDLDDLTIRWQVPGTPYAVAVDHVGTIRAAATPVGAGIDQLRTALERSRSSTTRRHVFVAGASAAAAAAGGIIALRAVARTGIEAFMPAAAQQDRNQFQGRCDAFVDYLVTKGVYVDLQGGGHPRHHPKTFGYTLVWPQGSSQVQVNTTENNRVVLRDLWGICDCPGQPVRYYYGQEQVTQCVTDCPSGLGCFAWQCRWRNRRTCVRVLVDVDVAEPPLTITMLTWTPPPAASKKCKNYANQINGDTRRHERQHAADARAVIDDVEKKYKKRPLYGCGVDEADAERELRANLNDLREQVRREVIRAEQARVKALHDAEGDRTVFDCRLCGE